MAGGQRPKPTALKRRQGNPGKRPLNEREPHPEPGIPEPPDWLSAEALVAWSEIAPALHGMNVLTKADLYALVLLCETWGEWRRARDAVATHGATYATKTQGGAPKISTRPEVHCAATAARQVRSMLIEFGLTPAARSKVQTAGNESEKNPLEALLERQRRRLGRGDR